MTELPPPEWVTGEYTGTVHPGLQLCTRDGRRIGNAITVSPGYYLGLGTEHRADVVTDQGTFMTLTFDEMRELFYRPEYFVDLKSHLGYKAWAKELDCE